MELRLEEKERRLLAEILQERHKSLIHEIARTDHREAKLQLQARCGLVEAILKRVETLESAAA
ncbi:MAG TPA: hypothetical protein VN620_08960 [Candidatus Methylomirabilis sp.]|nr:hypothetical protein [Candidatus Methylomirabilis sp.]